MSVRLSRWLVSILLRRIEMGSLIVTEGDERRIYGSGPPAATVQIDSPRAWPKLLRGSRGMAEAFAKGLWDSSDLVALIRLAAINAGGLDRLRSLIAPGAGRYSVPGRFCVVARGAGAAATSPPTTTLGTSSSRGCSIRR